MAFGVDVAQRGDATVVTVRGELDIATAPQVEDAVTGVTGRVVVDLSETSFLDSTGLRTLLAVAKGEGRELVVVCPPSNRPVLLVLELSGFDAVLERVETLEAAGVDAA